MPFVPDLPVLMAFAAASIILAVTPGPDMTLFVGRALSEGRLSAIACVAGTSTGIAIHTVLVAIGVSALVVASPTGFLVLKISGAAYLLWLAVQAVISGSAFRPKKEHKEPRSLVASWSQGLAVNLLNPKVVIFFMTFLPQFVSANDAHITGKLVFLGLLMNALFIPIGVGMVLIAGQLTDWLSRNKRIMRLIDFSFAGVFSTFAVRILLTEGR
ncbi:MAG: LysE family translocator [Alphaproteobacteria bacterium]|nr:LysE family translocator [Alphaproteobacteria bacterium]